MRSLQEKNMILSSWLEIGTSVMSLWNTRKRELSFKFQITTRNFSHIPLTTTFKIGSTPNSDKRSKLIFTNVLRRTAGWNWEDQDLTESCFELTPVLTLRISWVDSLSFVWSATTQFVKDKTYQTRTMTSSLEAHQTISASTWRFSSEFDPIYLTFIFNLQKISEKISLLDFIITNSL